MLVDNCEEGVLFWCLAFVNDFVLHGKEKTLTSEPAGHVFYKLSDPLMYV